MRLLNFLQGSSDPRNPETTRKLQVLQQFAILSVEDGKTNQSTNDSPMYMGLESHAYRIEDDKKDKETKKGELTEGTKMEKENKKMHGVEDGLLLVVPAKIYGKLV